MTDTTQTFPHGDRQIVLHGPDGDHLMRWISLRGHFYELWMLDYIARVARRGTLLDVGANIGNHTIYFSTLPQIEQIVAYEPFPPTFAFLTRNLSENQVSAEKVTAIPKAVGRQSGTVGMVNEEANNLGMSRIGGDENLVEIVSLDEQHGNDPVSVIKIDVEGHELEVLAGATGILRERKPDLFIEAGTEEEKAAIDKFLEPLGYRSVARFNYTPTFHYQHQGFFRKLRRWVSPPKFITILEPEKKKPKAS